MNVVTRIAPSPTGYMHIGTIRTALYNYLFAKKNGGKFVMRIEDTDTKRNRPEYEEDIREQFTWIGFAPEETVRQSDNLERHVNALKQMIESGTAYVLREPSKDDPSVEVDIVRLKNPNTTITFADVVRGDISFDTTELGDFVIARSPESPLYHFAVVVDDADMGITHVIRGEEHISNTPRQILIQEALGFTRPIYAHLALNLAADRSKLSKRKGDVSVRAYREQGYLPHALTNYLAILGWTPPSGKEILSLEEMVAEFDLKDLHKSGAVFDLEKLRWYNREYLAQMSDPQFQSAAFEVFRSAVESKGLPWSDEIGERLIPLLRERVDVWEDIRTQVAEGEYDFFFAAPGVDVEKLPQKGGSKEEARAHLERVHEIMASLSPETDYADAMRLKEALWDYATEKGRGNVLWPLRYALTGREKSPDPFAVASIIGKDATLERIINATRLLSS